ncbi:hypothetical protein ACFPZ0_16865, partial [Streptomonospora nanhaiensis]|uniref:hypothetical protein n=1 Tax=Streptomonospora nanhaiensis TaxID=1323731 RepID=UPI00361BDC50
RWAAADAGALGDSCAAAPPEAGALAEGEAAGEAPAPSEAAGEGPAEVLVVVAGDGTPPYSLTAPSGPADE